MTTEKTPWLKVICAMVGGQQIAIDLVCGYIPEPVESALCTQRGSEAMSSPARNVKTNPRPGPKPRKDRARVHERAGSQAVRLPKEFRFDTDRVAIWREGRHVVLSPMFKDWDDYLENGARFHR